MFGRIFFIDATIISTFNHLSIKNKPVGASEHQFYNLIGEFSKLNLKVICYNNTIEEMVIDNVQYKNIRNIFKELFYTSDKIIIQRLCGMIPSFEKNKIFVWMHDTPCEDLMKTCQTQTCKEGLHELYSRKNITFIFNSETCKKIYSYFFAHYGFTFEDSRCRVIYNILYEDDFSESKNDSYLVDINKIVFGSAWMKGIEKVIEVFRFIVKKNDKLELVLLSPGYDDHMWNDYKLKLSEEFQDRIKILGPLDKKNYCEVIKSSLCVLSASYFETFGCIFAESYYLGTPVIADVKCGAVKEIIDNQYIVDYSNPETVLEKLLDLQKTRNNINIKLDDKFLVDENMLLWKTIVLF
jgi:glycosyltransferase involved in cell wall biosynthesis